MTVPASISEGGVSLSSKYLGIASKASDSERLDGINGSNFIYMSDEKSLAGTAGHWITIATSGSGRAFAHFLVYDTDSGKHNSVHLIASTAYGQNSVTKLHGDTYANKTITKARMLYNTTDRIYGGSKLQIYLENDCTVRVKMQNESMGGWTGFANIAPIQEDLPSGWTVDPMNQ